MKREEQIFEQAIALASAQARQVYLLGACGDDRDLRRRLDELLDAFQDADQMAFLRTGDRSNESHALTQTTLAEGPGTRIGRYKLLDDWSRITPLRQVHMPAHVFVRAPA